LIVATAMQVGIGPLPIRLFPDSHGNHPPFLTMPRKKSTAVAIRRGQPADAMSRIKECEKNPPSGGVTVETARWPPDGSATNNPAPLNGALAGFTSSVAPAA